MPLIAGSSERRLRRVVGLIAVAGLAERLVLAVAVLIPAVALVAASFGDAGGALGGAVGSSIGVGGARLFRNRRYLRLPRDQRSRVWRAQLTGHSTSDSRLDQVAAERLDFARQNFMLDRIFVAVLLVVGAGGAVYAVERIGALWFVAAAPALAALVLATAWHVVYDPRPRLAVLGSEARIDP